MSWKESESRLVMSDSLWPHGLYSPWNSPGQNIGVGSLSLLRGIFPTQGSNPGLLHCRQILYQLSHQGSPRILEWVACPFSSRSSRPRNRTGVSCITGRFFTNWAIREAQNISKCNLRCCPPDNGWDVNFENIMSCLRACLVAQSCLSICDPLVYRPPGSSVHEIFQASTLEQDAISWPRDWIYISCVSCIGRWAYMLSHQGQILYPLSPNYYDQG